MPSLRPVRRVAELGSLGRTAHHNMQRTITIAVIALATVAAAAAVWFWALRPLGFASYLSSTGASDADIIRQYWPHRLVQPEWVSATPDRLMNWHFAEVCARLAVVAVSWSLTVGGFFYGVIKRRRVRPNQALQRSARLPLSCIRSPWASRSLSLGR